MANRYESKFTEWNSTLPGTVEPTPPWPRTPVKVNGPEVHLTDAQVDQIIQSKYPLAVPKVEVDPSGKPLNSPGAKGDAGKVQAWLFLAGFGNALEEVANVTTVGAKKYTRNGWKTVENGSERYMEAFGRHMLDLAQGKLLDDEEGGTGCYHKANMIWNLLASLELDLTAKKQ